MQAKILWIEGKQTGNPTFVSGLQKKGYSVEVFSTGKAAMAHLAQINPDLIVINASSFRSSGARVSLSARNGAGDMPILFIANPEHPVNGEIGATIILELPFTIRKLVNRIIALLPGESNDLLKAGPIQLDLKRKQVRCQSMDAQLTPRLTKLLQIFMEHPGVVLEREKLFRDVWKTEYIADTRTLDVHISWLRRAIEKNPRKPEYLKTIRGVGYRLDT